MQRYIIYWIEGDGIGPEIWRAARPVIDKAAENSDVKFDWIELMAGEKALKKTGVSLPTDTLNILKNASLAMKGPLGTPVGTGIRSLNVALRKALDLYACIRPISHITGLSTPVKRPDLVNMTIFRENTEDVYAGIEYAANSPEANKLAHFLHDELGAPEIPDGSAIGLKPVSEQASKRLVRRAIQYALDHNLPSVTLMHKGNIMKFTEGGFRAWGYEVAREEFGKATCTETDPIPGKLLIKDRIADAMFQEALLHPEKYSVIATPNLNGDYISDALAAQVGGLGVAPGVNMSDTLAIFEATHGTAPGIAGMNKANPTSLVLCGAMLLEHIGKVDSAKKIRKAIENTILEGEVTEDIACQLDNAKIIGCHEFGQKIQKNLAAL